MNHLKSLNLSLQGKEKTVLDLSRSLLGFEAKTLLFIKDLECKKFKFFPLLKLNVNNIQDDNNKQFQENYKCRFEDLKQLQATFSFFVNPFLCDVLNDEFLLSDIILAKPDVGKLELLEMKEDIVLKMHHKSTSLVEFWKLVNESQYPQSCCSFIFNIWHNVLL